MRAVINEAGNTADRDGIITKIAKFIPGEITSVYAALAAASVLAAQSLNSTTPPDWPLVVAFAAGLIGSPLYWYLTTKSSKKTDPDRVRTTRWYAYLLSAIAFVPWALAVSNDTRVMLGVPDALAEYLLVLAAFVIPTINAALEATMPEKQP